MKCLAMVILACLLALAFSVALVWCAVLYHDHGLLGFRCGLLHMASDPYPYGFC